MGLRNEQLRWQLAKGLVQALHLERLASLSRLHNPPPHGTRFAGT